jgi:hypothetical protein
VRYQPIPRLAVTVKGSYLSTGRDSLVPPYTNWGQDINKSYDSRQQDYNNKVAQGTDNTIIFSDIQLSYMLRHNFFIDFRQTMRNSTSPDPAFNNNTSLSTFAIRWNIAARNYDF